MTIHHADPHAGQPVFTHGQPLSGARAAVILLHGRGGTADDILRLSASLPQAGLSYLAPQAAGGTWYPQRFFAPLAANEPWLSSALGVVRKLLEEIIAAGVARERVLVGGFSQGACLALESIARLGGRLGGGFALSGGLIGPSATKRAHDHAIDGTPVFLGCGDNDTHIPLASVEESARVLRSLGAVVTDRIYPGLGHGVIQDEIQHVSALIDVALASGD